MREGKRARTCVRERESAREGWGERGSEEASEGERIF